MRLEYPKRFFAAVGLICATHAYAVGSCRPLLDGLMSQGQLFHQLDPELGERGYIVADGGMCGSTCTLNLLTVLDKKLGVNGALVKNPFNGIDDMAAHLRQKSNIDLSDSVTVFDISTYLNKVFKALPESSRPQIKARILSTNSSGIDIDELKSRDEEMIVGIAAYDPKRLLKPLPRESEWGHALMISDYDPATRTALFFDPTQPNVLRKAFLKKAILPTDPKEPKYPTIEIEFQDNRLGFDKKCFVTGFVKVKLPKGAAAKTTIEPFTWNKVDLKTLNSDMPRRLAGQRIKLDRGRAGDIEFGTVESVTYSPSAGAWEFVFKGATKSTVVKSSSIADLQIVDSPLARTQMVKPVGGAMPTFIESGEYTPMELRRRSLTPLLKDKRIEMLDSKGGAQSLTVRDVWFNAELGDWFMQGIGPDGRSIAVNLNFVPNLRVLRD